MNAFTPFFDVSAAGSMVATVSAREAKDMAPPEQPPPFAAIKAACPAATVAACRKAAWRKIADALFDLVSGPRL